MVQNYVDTTIFMVMVVNSVVLEKVVWKKNILAGNYVLKWPLGNALSSARKAKY